MLHISEKFKDYQGQIKYGTLINMFSIIVYTTSRQVKEPLSDLHNTAPRAYQENLSINHSQNELALGFSYQKKKKK